MINRSRRRWRSAAAAALAVGSLDAVAGLSLEESLERHRAWLDVDGAAAIATADGLTATRADGFTLAMARRVPPGPALLGATGPPAGGLQWLVSGGASGGALRWRWGGTVHDRDEHRFDFDGSIVSLPLGPGRVYLSSERRHWGPAWTASLILDGAAPPVPALGWRKTDASRFDTGWLAWLGPWSADVFFGQLSGRLPPEHVKLIGLRLNLVPLPDLEIGLSRTLQWGGDGRPQDPRSLLRALLGVDNVEGPDHSDEPGNQLGGFDLRYTLRLPRHAALAVYGQAIGEDEAGSLPSRYLGSAGIDLAFAAGGGTWRLFAERANTVAGAALGKPFPGTAYRHPLYPSGYAQRGEPLGHPAGGDVAIDSLGLIAERGPVAATLRVHRGHAEAAAPQFAVPGPLRGADLAVAWRLPAGFSAGATVAHWRDSSGRRTQAQAWWRLDWR
jgi:hypothetical protein